MVVHFLAHTETLDHVIKTKCKVLSFLGIANSGKGMTMRGIIGCTCPRKYAPGNMPQSEDGSYFPINTSHYLVSKQSFPRKIMNYGEE